MSKALLYVLVKNFQGVNHDVGIFDSEKSALAAFRRYTGFKWTKQYTDPQNASYNEDYSETKIFEVPFRARSQREK